MIAVIGASGFIGQAVLEALNQRGEPVVVLRAPRVITAARSAGELLEEARLHPSREALVAALEGVDCVINCAGVAEAGSTDSDALYGANALLPAIVDAATDVAGVARFVQVSSAGVQGRTVLLDESAAVSPISPYTRSKALAESALFGRNGVVIFRPTSVHGAGRSVTERLARFARTPAASVAGEGSAPTPQVLVENVADAITTVSLAATPPDIAMQPSEGLTVRDVLVLLGGREPRHVPTDLAGALLRVGSILGRIDARAVASVRRLEMLWFGQSQATTWLDGQGWRPPLGRDAWIGLAQRCRTSCDERLKSG